MGCMSVCCYMLQNVFINLWFSSHNKFKPVSIDLVLYIKDCLPVSMCSRWVFPLFQSWLRSYTAFTYHFSFLSLLEYDTVPSLSPLYTMLTFLRAVIRCGLLLPHSHVEVMLIWNTALSYAVSLSASHQESCKKKKNLPHNHLIGRNFFILIRYELYW